MFANNFNFFYTLFILLFIFWVVSKVNAKIDEWISWKKQPIVRFAIQITTNITLSIFIFLFFRLISILLINISFLSENYGYTSFTDIQTILYIVIIYMVLFVFIDLSIFLLNQWRLSLADLESFKKENVEFKLNMLRSQINPHFLFNSLNTLSSLIYENQDQASKYTKKLSAIYRNILELKDTETFTLSEELNALNQYFDLLKIRFGNALNLEIKCSEEIKQTLIPPLTLQLLVENCIKHNIVSEKKPLKITISTNDFFVVVQNNFQPKTAISDSTEIGLKNIKSRYQYLTSAPIMVEQTENLFTVKLPIIYAN